MAQFYASDAPALKDVPASVLRTIASLPDDYCACLDFRIGGDADIDFALLGPRGIYVFEVKDKFGVIQGTVEKEAWTAQNGNDVHEFPNPYRQLRRYTSAFQNLLQRNFKDVFIQPRFRAEEFYRAPVYAYALFPRWEKGSSFESDRWTIVVKGLADFVPSLSRRNWADRPASAGVDLTAEEIDRIATRLLGLRRTTLERILPGRPVFRAPIDERVQKDLRQKEIEELKISLSREHALALLGEPMVGKSSLAYLYAEVVAAAGTPVFNHDFRERSFRIMTERFFDALGIAPVPNESQDRIAILVDALCKRQVLCILDNFESVLREDEIADSDLSSFVDQVLRYRPQMASRVVVTCRRRFVTARRNEMPTMTCGGIEPALAVSLLRGRYSLSPDQASRVVEVTRGHPHGMHVAAIQIQEYGAANLTSVDQLVHGGLQEIGEKLYHDYQGLQSAEMQLINLIALEHEGMTTEILKAIAGGMNSSLADPWRMLMRLHRLGIVSVTREGTVRLLPLLQEYVYKGMENRNIFHGAAFAHYRDQLSRTSGAERSDLILVAIRHGIGAGLAAEALSMLFADGFWEQMEWGGRFGPILKLAMDIRSLPGYGDVPKPEAALLLLSEGRTRAQAGDVDAGRVLIDQAAQLFQQLGDSVSEAKCLSELGLVTRKLGQFGKHEYEYYERALALLEDNLQPEALSTTARVLSRLARAQELGNTAPADVLRLRERALQMARSLEDKNLLVSCLGAVAGSHLQGRRFREAHEYYTQALAVARAGANQYRIAQALAGLGKVEERLRNFARAREIFLESLRCTYGVFDRIDRLGSLGHASKCLQKYDDATGYYEEALELSERMKNPKAIAENLDGLGAVYRDLGDLQRSLDYLSRAVEVQEAIDGDPAGLANRYAEVARTRNRMGAHAEARSLTIRAIRTARKSHRKYLEGWLLNGLGDTYRAEGNHATAALCYLRAEQILKGEPAAADMRRRKEKSLGHVEPEERPDVARRLQDAAAEVERILDDEDPEGKNGNGSGNEGR